MLMHADNGGVDHLDSSIMGSGKCVYDAASDTSPPPPNEAVVACGVRTKRLGQVTPSRSGAQEPKEAIEDTTVVHPRNGTRLVRQHRLDSNPFIIGEFVAHDLSPRFGSLNHGDLAGRNALGPARLTGRSGHHPSTPPLNPSKMNPNRTCLRMQKLPILVELPFAPCV